MPNLLFQVLKTNQNFSASYREPSHRHTPLARCHWSFTIKGRNLRQCEEGKEECRGKSNSIVFAHSIERQECAGVRF